MESLLDDGVLESLVDDGERSVRAEGCLVSRARPGIRRELRLVTRDGFCWDILQYVRKPIGSIET